MNDLRQETEAREQDPGPLWAKATLAAVLVYAGALVVLIVADILGKLG